MPTKDFSGGAVREWFRNNTLPRILADSFDVDEGRIGNESLGSFEWWPDDRKLFSNDIQDYTATDAQDAQNWIEDNIPLIRNHRVRVTIPTGDHSTPIEIPPIASGPRWTRRGGSGLRTGLIIEGDSNTATDTKIPWVAGGGVEWCIVRDIAFKSAASDWGETAGVIFYDTLEVALVNVEFTGGTDGVTAYNSNIHINSVDLGASVLSGDGIKAKHGGFIQEEQAVSNPVSGTVSGNGYVDNGNGIVIRGASSTLSAGASFVVTEGPGVFDSERQSIITQNGELFQGLRGGRPTPSVSDAAYLDDGSGTPSAGWYITTDGGSNWTAV